MSLQDISIFAKYFFYSFLIEYIFKINFFLKIYKSFYFSKILLRENKDIFKFPHNSHKTLGLKFCCLTLKCSKFSPFAITRSYTSSKTIVIHNCVFKIQYTCL